MLRGQFSSIAALLLLLSPLQILAKPAVLGQTDDLFPHDAFCKYSLAEQEERFSKHIVELGLPTVPSDLCDERMLLAQSLAMYCNEYSNDKRQGMQWFAQNLQGSGGSCRLVMRMFGRSDTPDTTCVAIGLKALLPLFLQTDISRVPLPEECVSILSFSLSCSLRKLN